MLSFDAQNEEALLKAVTNQPIAVGICADQSLMFYSSGIITKVRRRRQEG